MHPHGVCDDSTLACDLGVCTAPPCSIANPTGSCPQGLECRDGDCQLPLCSMGTPSGYCPNGDVCNAGVCEEGPCGTDNLNGTCVEQVFTYHPTLGVTYLDFVCCDGSALSGTSCALGSCTVPLCTVAEPHGVCPDGQYCNAGTCESAACDPFFPTGTCAPGLTCTFGRCLKVGCNGQPAAYCDPDVCDTVLNACVPPPCSPTHVDGFCPIGQACVAGACGIPDCSSQYPGGQCVGADEGKLCVGGHCIDPPCSSTYPTGACGPNFACNNGICELATCSLTAPLGSCPSGERCYNGGCETYVCSATFPTGPCSIGTVCTGFGPSCVTPACSATYPGGACPAFELCAGGVCVPLPCSSSNPTGPCGAGFTCSSGTCVAAACSVSVPNGTCAGAQVCYNGGCVDYVCGTNFPSGPCPVGNICDNAQVPPVCILPPCSVAYPGGFCASPNVCVNGACTLPACSPAVPNGQCPPSQVCCDTAQITAGLCTVGDTGICVRALCDSANPQGRCDPGYACNAGTCEATLCSPTYLYGQCVGADAGKVCVAGTCVDPCAPAHKLGWCPSGFGCVEGACSFGCAGDDDCDAVADSAENIAVCAGATTPGTCVGVTCLWHDGLAACLADTDLDGAPDRVDRDADGDLVPDAIEAGDLNISTPPADTDGDGTPNLRDLDADGDHISDTFEVGPAPALPRDSDGDGADDYVDTDSDNDGVYDRCEVADLGGGLCNASGIVDLDLGLGAVSDFDGDGLRDYLDTDSDGDGTPDTVEARAMPASAGTLSALGVDHDADGLPDYRDDDSDGDGVADADEDVNGDGIVDCQVDGSGAVVLDTRATPACGSTTSPFSPSNPYNYNPGCVATGDKCLLAESSRVHIDSDGDGIADGDDGVFLVCSTANLKPINLFYSQQADYALALEQSYTTTRGLTRSGTQTGMAFDDSVNATGSYAVSGFVLRRAPSAAAMAATDPDPARALIEKALAQENGDRALYAAAAGVSSVSLVINRNFTSFDGYGVVISRYRIVTAASTATAALRDLLAGALDSTVTGFGGIGGPSATDFTLITETLYRYDDGVAGAVMVVGALAPTGSTNTANTYSYRTRCNTLDGNQAGCLARVGCSWSSPSCVENPAYQIPLFFADNVTSGSALAQYGDDTAALCQSLIQENGKIDFLWTVDNSGSMAQEIGQVQASAKLFFEIFDNTEADYRVAQTTSNNGTASQTAGSTAASFPSWEAQFNFGEGFELTPTLPLASDGDEPGGLNGYLTGEFTGAIAGIVNTGSTDRTVTYTCSQGCYIESCIGQNQATCATRPECRWTGTTCEADCCPSCAGQPGATVVNDPACYFAARLPDEDGNGAEHTLLMANWAAYRAGARPTCSGATNATDCGALPGCTWASNNTCIPNNCVAPAALGVSYTQETCNGNDPNPGNNTRLFDVPYGADTLEDEYEPPMCEWNAATSACWPSIGTPCAAYAAQSTCTGLCATYTAQAACQADTSCQWFTTSNPTQCRSTACGAYAAQADCDANPGCYWWNPPGNTNNRCTDRGSLTCFTQTAQGACDAIAACQWRTSGSAACFPRGTASTSRCAWNSTASACLPTTRAYDALCSGTTQAMCAYATGGFCQWNAGTSTCSAPPRRAFRSDAYRFLVLLTDEEECMNKDNNWSGDCSEYFAGSYAANDPLRLARTNSFLQILRARGFTTFAIAGDKGTGATGCTSATGGSAEPSNTVISVSESTGGGWGSICAADLYPTIEAVVIGAIGKASPYRLEGFIDGHAVQPISSTIKVSAEVCDVPGEYPSCASGTHMEVVPRSRENGFDYDSSSNALVLYGSARPVVGGDIVASYRYWVDNLQPPQGNPTCPCPETSGPGCLCPAGQACGIEGATNHCIAQGTQPLCEATAGCSWNTVAGCVANGLCEADPTCGGACGTGEVCDPATGLCICDLSCGASCGAGQSCDTNIASPTCGTCLCDDTCGGGCPAGQLCNSNLASPSCGSCYCDTTCGGCTAGLLCDSNTASPSCGFCLPPQCGSCGPGQVCDPVSGLCVCDTICGGGCPVGTACDADTLSSTCGLCVCDPTCGGGTPACPLGQACDTDTGSGTCGLCQADPTCGVGGNCNTDCSAGTTSTTCVGISGCRWAAWLNGGAGACSPVACEVCNPTVGLCVADTACCGACGPNESCNTLTGQCQCDTTCGYACAPGLTCDGSTVSPTCGECVCDTSCGGACPQGLVCDDNSRCSPYMTLATCQANAECSWSPDSLRCLTATCGHCIVDPTCGGCNVGEACDPTTGLCVAQCPDCLTGTVCETATGTCICDTTCGGICPWGTQCDSDPISATCGACVCDTTCGGGCPQCQACDSSPASGTCGLCLADTTCGGGCGTGEVCDSLTGCCIADPNCGGFCPTGYLCDPLLGRCVYVGEEG
ncbi:MAG: hypothetical protein AAB426_02735 [Myxococcota bacterium]